jgi:hypothetical protein
MHQTYEYKKDYCDENDCGPNLRSKSYFSCLQKNVWYHKDGNYVNTDKYQNDVVKYPCDGSKIRYMSRFGLMPKKIGRCDNFHDRVCGNDNGKYNDFEHEHHNERYQNERYQNEKHHNNEQHNHKFQNNEYQNDTHHDNKYLSNEHLNNENQNDKYQHNKHQNDKHRNNKHQNNKHHHDNRMNTNDSSTCDSDSTHDNDDTESVNTKSCDQKINIHKNSVENVMIHW